MRADSLQEIPLGSAKADLLYSSTPELVHERDFEMVSAVPFDLPKTSSHVFMGLVRAPSLLLC
jgi:hypothetical protein